MHILSRTFKLLFVLTIFFSENGNAQNLSTRIITANLKQPATPLNTSFKECVGAGRANEGLRADWQRQLRLVKQECDFKYIRFHGLLSDDMGVYKEDKNGNPSYNWQYIDELYDFLLSIKMKPFVELGFMPNALASGNKTVFWWKGNVTPPKDYTKWDDLIKSLVQHWTERYGEDEVASWYFEVWNEPNLKGLFFTGNQSDYFKMYQETVASIKKVSTRYRVGGPATAGNAWIPEMIAFCAKDNIPIDFITTHEYGVKQGFVDVTGDVGTIINENKNAVSNNMRRSKDMILESSLPKLPLHYTEWSSSYTPTDAIHDTYEQAAFILNTIKRASPYLNSMSYWTFTDIFEEFGPRFSPFHGGFGLLNYQDIKKPAFYAFKFLNQLGHQQFETSDSSSYICQDEKGNVQALFWDCTIDHPGDSTNDQEFYKRDIPAKPALPLTLKLQGLKPGKYTVNLYQTGYRINDAYATYLNLGSPAQLTRAQVNTIKQENANKPIATNVITVAADGKFEKNFPMRQNDVYFITLSKQ